MTPPSNVMPLSENTKVVKIYVKKVTLDALRQVADEQGSSLSQLLLGAAVEKYLGGKSTDRAKLASLERKVRGLEQAKQAEVSVPLPSPKRENKNLYPKTFKQSAAPIITSTREQLGLDALVKRLGGTSSLKARLCQLGGRGSGLFEGDLTRAEKVAQITGKLDPDGKSWLPLTPNRLTWIQISAQEYCHQILTNLGSG